MNTGDTEIYIDDCGVPRWKATLLPVVAEQYPVDYAQVPRNCQSDVPKLLFYLGLFVAFCLLCGLKNLLKGGEA